MDSQGVDRLSGFTVRAYRPSNLNKNKSLRKRAEDKRTRGVSRLSAMDPILVKGLREAKQLLCVACVAAVALHEAVSQWAYLALLFPNE